MTTLRSLLNPGYEPGDGTMDGAQLVDGQWWHPHFGCDSLQYVVDNARQALVPEVAPNLHTQRGPMTFKQELKPGIAITMLPIPAGSFLMGSPKDEPDRFDDEGPQHEVTLGAFWMAQTPTTQAQWRTVAGWPKVERDLDPDPAMFKGANHPVEQVNWYDAMEFCRRLSQRTGQRYGLPSEAQWEYACRAGSSTPFCFGDTLTPEQANCNDSETVEVASHPANAWGLHDMHGNVWEWCADHWHNDYEGAPNDGSAWEDCSLGESEGCCAAGRGTTSPGSAARPTATTSTRTSASSTSVSASVASDDKSRLLRGGSWGNDPGDCRSACRLDDRPGGRGYSIGFRVCCLPQD